MHGSALSFGPAELALAFFGPPRKAIRPNSQPGKPALKRVEPAVVPARRRVPISAWQTHSWTKKIVPRSFEPDMPERVRVLRRAR